MKSFKRYLVEKEGGGAQTSAAGAVAEFGFQQSVKRYSHHFNAARASGMDDNAAHLHATHAVAHGTAGSKGGPRLRISSYKPDHPVAKASKSLGDKTTREIGRHGRFAGLAWADHSAKMKKAVVDSKRTGEDVHGRTMIGNKSIGNSDVVTKHETGDHIGASLKYSREGKDSTVKIHNPGGASFAKTVEDFHEKAFGKTKGYKRPDLQGKYAAATGGVKGARTELTKQHSKTLGAIFGDTKKTSFLNTHGQKVTHDAENGKLNGPGASYIRSIARGDSTVKPEHRKHQEWAKGFAKSWTQSGSGDTSGYMSTLHKHVHDIMSKGDPKVGHAFVNHLLGVKSHTIDTRLVVVKNQKSGTPSTSIYNVSAAAKNNHKAQPEGRYSTSHTKGTQGFKVGAITVGHDRGTMNIAVPKSYLKAGHEATYGNEKGEIPYPTTKKKA